MAIVKKTKAEPINVSLCDEADIDVRMVDIGELTPNSYNPNDMEAELFESLVEAVKAEGMNQPILVRPSTDGGNSFIIVDGENRYTAAKLAGIKRVAVVVVPYSEDMARVRTISYNAIKGRNIPIKLARILVDLQKTYSDVEIRRMTGVREDEQQSVLDLLKVPDFSPQSSVHISAGEVERPIQVNLLLMPDEHKHYTTAMRKAMKLVGDDVVVLIGNEVADYDKAMKATMGISGVKMRNLALAMICRAFVSMPAETQEALIKEASTMIFDKKEKDAVELAEKKDKTDHHVTT